MAGRRAVVIGWCVAIVGATVWNAADALVSSTIATLVVRVCVRTRYDCSCVGMTAAIAGGSVTTDTSIDVTAAISMANTTVDMIMVTVTGTTNDVCLHSTSFDSCDLH